MEIFTGDTSEEDFAPAEGKEPPLPPVDLLDRLLFPVFVLVFLGVLVFFEGVQRIAVLLGPRWHDKAAAALNRNVLRSLRILGTRFDIRGIAPLPLDRPLLVISNHQSMFDVSTLHSIFGPHHARFVAKRELSRGIPSVSYCLRASGAAIIDRKDPSQALPEINKLGERAAQNNFGIVIFPEGTRARRGALKEFRRRGVTTLLDVLPHATVVPVALDNSWKIASRPSGPVPRCITIHVRVGIPIERKGLSSNEIVDEAQKRVKSMLEEIRSEFE